MSLISLIKKQNPFNIHPDFRQLSSQIVSHNNHKLNPFLFLSLGLANVLLPMVSVGEAKAISLGLYPAAEEVSLTQQVEVSLTISELEDTSVGAIDLNLHFDSEILEVDKVTFGDPILGDQIDLSGHSALFAMVGYQQTTAGSLNLFEVSFDLPQHLDTFQADSFTVATFTFNTLSVGTSFLELTDVILGNALGTPLEPSLSHSSVEVNSVTSVPEPSLGFLAMTTLLLPVLAKSKIVWRYAPGNRE